MNLLSARLEAAGIENNSLTLQIPQYLPLEEDFSAAAALLEAVGAVLGEAPQLEASILGLRVRGEQQYERLSQMVAGDPQLSQVVEQLERVYDDKSSGELRLAALGASGAIVHIRVGGLSCPP